MTRRNIIVLASSLIVVIIGLIAAWQSSYWQVVHLLGDDAYYYFQLARNAAHGLGASLDGIHHTNGFHPLWMVILTIIYKVFPDHLTIPIALSFSALLGGLTIWLLGKLLIRLKVSNGWLAIGLGLVVFNPWLILQWVNGLETAVASLFLVGFWYYVVKIWQEQKLSIKSLIISSALASLAALGRTDAAIIVAPVLIWLWWQISKQGSIGSWILNAVGIAAVVLIIQSPWIIWNYHNFNTITQSSGASFSYTNHQLLLIPQGQTVKTYVKGMILGSYNAARIVWQTLMSPLVYVIALLYVLLLRFKLKQRLVDSSRGLIIIIGVGIILHLAVHGAVRWAFRPWYAVPFLIYLSLLIAYLSVDLPRIIFSKIIRYCLISFAIISFLVTIPRVLSEYQDQAVMYNVAQWINSQVAVGEKVGAFNSGVYAYFSGRTVVNLDGLVNNKVATALHNHQLWDFAKEEKLVYLIDYDRYVNYRYAWAWGQADYQQQLGQSQVLGESLSGKILLFKFPKF